MSAPQPGGSDSLPLGERLEAVRGSLASDVLTPAVERAFHAKSIAATANLVASAAASAGGRAVQSASSAAAGGCGVREAVESVRAACEEAEAAFESGLLRPRQYELAASRTVANAARGGLETAVKALEGLPREIDTFRARIVRDTERLSAVAVAARAAWEAAAASGREALIERDRLLSHFGDD